VFGPGPHEPGLGAFFHGGNRSEVSSHRVLSAAVSEASVKGCANAPGPQFLPTA